MIIDSKVSGCPENSKILDVFLSFEDLMRDYPNVENSRNDFFKGTDKKHNFSLTAFK